MMDEFYNAFSTISKQEWLETVNKQLKGKKADDFLKHYDSIEEIEFSSISVPEENPTHAAVPGSGDFSRGNKTENNDWVNNVIISGNNPSKLNASIHQFLMNGATGLKIDLGNLKVSEIETLCKNVSFKDIHALFYYSSKEQFDWLNDLWTADRIVGTAINKSEQDFGLVKNARNYLIKAIDVQYAGGNVVQEIAYALHKGHEAIFQLIKNGQTIEDAAQQLKFQFGIGSNYFFEIIKFKVFRSLWSSVVAAYKPKSNLAKKSYIEAETGFLNKSLKDPHTNLLRLTTEALSAVVGGTDELTIRTPDAWSKNGKSEKSTRLALNIALLLKEEAYFDKVIDPAGGAYILEMLSADVRKKAWELFQKIEKKELEYLKNEIRRIRKERVRLIESKERTLIGINNFLNPEIVENVWNVEVTTPFGSPLILETEYTGK